MKLPVQFAFVLAPLVVCAGTFGSHSTVAAQEDAESKSPAAKAPASPNVSDYGISQVRRINQEIRAVWQDSKVRPSAAATDNEWCRRVYLDVLGRIPSVQELRDYVTSREANKKVKLV